MKKRPIPIVEAFVGVFKPFGEIFLFGLYMFTGWYRCDFCNQMKNRKEPLHRHMIDVSGYIYKLCDSCNKRHYG